MIKKFNQYNESASYTQYNRVILLIEYKMAQKGWTAFTEDSYANELASLTDDEILEMYSKYDSEIEEMSEFVRKFKDNI